MSHADGVACPLCGNAIGLDLMAPLALAPLLTERETTVAAGIIEGKDKFQIARDLGIAHSTVKNHLTSIFEKLHVNNRTQAAIVLIKGSKHFQYESEIS